MAQRNIRLTLAYEGTRYHGWQRQVGQISIQEVLEQAASKIVCHEVRVIGAGRTDSGVHALGQVCNFAIHSPIPVQDLRKGLNSLLPEDIRVLLAEEVPCHFHSRYHAKRKIYVYRILNAQQPDIFARRYEWHIPVALETKAMAQCLSIVKGTHDFSAFRSSGSSNRNPVRTVFRAEIAHGTNPSRILMLYEADGFLRHMVRNIVGTVVSVGLGKIKVQDFRRILESRDRKRAGMKAPSKGLFLVKVLY
ncbi:MAG: tRNA pseudouridine(38-40) synthase TruA [Deltaproteobacteria bacterium]|nr:MAG: tRNA pseudouridine(38-40) synthase TruA [Deltaproteobacteria bacterium]